MDTAPDRSSSDLPAEERAADERPASERLAERMAALPADEREALAEDTLDLLDEAERIRALIAPALASFDRGKGRPLEGHHAFMERMRREHDL